MWVDEAEELFKGYFPYYLLIVLPVFILIMPANPVAASHEIPVCRMQHYDLHGISHGRHLPLLFPTPKTEFRQMGKTLLVFGKVQHIRNHSIQPPPCI